VQHAQSDDHGLTVAQAIAQGTAVAVSDGSLCYTLGTSAFVIEGATPDHHVCSATTESLAQWRKVTLTGVSLLDCVPLSPRSTACGVSIPLTVASSPLPVTTPVP